MTSRIIVNRLCPAAGAGLRCQCRDHNGPGGRPASQHRREGQQADFGAATGRRDRRCAGAGVRHQPLVHHAYTADQCFYSRLRGGGYKSRGAVSTAPSAPTAPIRFHALRHHISTFPAPLRMNASTGPRKPEKGLGLHACACLMSTNIHRSVTSA